MEIAWVFKLCFGVTFGLLSQQLGLHTHPDKLLIPICFPFIQTAGFTHYRKPRKPP